MNMTETEPPKARGFQPPPMEDEEGAPETSPASPEEQEQYNAFVENMLKVIYGDKKRLNTILSALKASDDPVQDLAATVATLVKRVEDSAEGAKMQLAEGVAFHAGVEILEDLAELAEKAGIHAFTEEEMETAGYRAIDLYRAAKGNGDQDKAGAELAELMNKDPKMAEVVGRIAGAPPAGKGGDEPSINPETGAEEFWAEGSGDLGGSEPGVNAGVGGTGEGGSGLGSLLERALDYVNQNPVGVLSAAMPGSGVIGAVAGFAGKQNEKQGQEAMVAGNFNENGSLHGRGFAGEKVGISLSEAGPVNADTGVGGPNSGRGGEGGGRGDAEAPPPVDLSKNYHTTNPAARAAPARDRARGFRQVRV